MTRATRSNSPVRVIDATGTYLTIAGVQPTTRRGFSLRPPRVLGSPPATTAGVNNAASAFAGSVLVPVFEPGCFTFLGGPVAQDSGIDGYGAKLGNYQVKTSSAPVLVEFFYETADATGRFEIYWKGGGACRVAIQQADGSWGYVSAGGFSHTNGLYYDLVTLGAAGLYRIRLEFDPSRVFMGITAGPTDTVSATLAPKRYIVVGDSFTEPTIEDSGSFVYGDGWPVQLSYLTGLDIWCAGSGGTGYLNPNSGASRVKFRDRLAGDILYFQPDGIIWAGGINDYGIYTPAQIGAEALACYQQALAAGVTDQIVLSPFWPKALTASGAITNLLATHDQIAAAAAQVRGCRYLNLFEMPDTLPYLSKWQGTTWTGSTLQALTTVGANQISLASIPLYMTQGPATKSGWYVRVGNDQDSEIRAVTNVTGTGPYTLTLSPNLSVAHAAGAVVTLSGPSYMTGTGKQGATTGTGNADRYTGNGGTHPTKAGHAHIARTVAKLWSRSLAG